MIESGKRNNRVQLAAALAACKRLKARLVVAKLDRLARNVAFISKLMESGVEFTAADMPFANKLTIHILAAVAEHEREAISARTKAALAAAKARGVKLGGPKLKQAQRRAVVAICIAALLLFADTSRRSRCSTRSRGSPPSTMMLSRRKRQAATAA